MYEELGIPPLDPKDKGSKEKERWSKIKLLAQENRLEEIDASVYVRLYGTLKRIAKDHMSPAVSNEATCGIWISGSTGTGKSHVVRTRYPNAYQKPLNKWWDGYQNQEVVHLDEIAPSHTMWITPYLKKWADKWSYPAETKGGAISIRPKLFIVTSNYTIEQMGFSPEDHEAITRRFRQVVKTRDQDIII